MHVVVLWKRIMKVTNRKPKWWQISFLIVLILTSLFGLRYFSLHPVIYRALQVLGIVVGYLLLLAWLRINADAIEAEDHRQRKSWGNYHIDSGPKQEV